MVHWERDSVVGDAADQYERIHGLPMVIRVRSEAFKVRFRILATNGVHGRSARHSESIINVIPGIEFARLVTRADNKCVGTALNQLLRFGEIGALREGRFLVSADSEKRVCVVDEDFARYWSTGGAIGQRLFLAGSERADADAFTVVGVVGAMKQAELTEAQTQGAVYVPYQYRTVANIFTVNRTSQRPETFGLSLQKIVRAIDPELPVNDLRSMEVRIADSLIVRRSPALLAGLFAAVALLLAAIGTYGVLAYAVAQRRCEIGVRMALGALPKAIGNQFLCLGLRLLMAGTAVGVFGAWLAGCAMQSILFDVPTLPVATLAGTSVIMTVVSLTACWLPARRAARVDPMEALRCE
jgi:hypothetical protein